MYGGMVWVGLGVRKDGLGLWREGSNPSLSVRPLLVLITHIFLWVWWVWFVSVFLLARALGSNKLPPPPPFVEENGIIS